MKNYITLISCVGLLLGLSNFAFAESLSGQKQSTQSTRKFHTMTWAQIRASHNLLGAFPTIPMAGSLVTVDELCVDGDHLRLATNGGYRERCVAWASDEASTCLEMKQTYYSAPLDYTSEECLLFDVIGDGMECVQYEATQLRRALSYRVTVFEVGPESRTPVLVKNYTIPQCKRF